MKRGLKYALLIAAMIALTVLVRLFFVGSYRITATHTGETVKAGDCVLVNRLKIGENPARNRLILYTSPLRRDADDPPFLVGRCVGLPNDVVQMSADGFRINGALLPNMPLMQTSFRIRKNIGYDIMSAMNLLKIPVRDAKEDSSSIILRLSLKEKDLLANCLAKFIEFEPIEGETPDYEFVIPRVNKSLLANPVTLMVCREAIMSEAGDMPVEIKDNKLYINDIEAQAYMFGKDYYWVLSEDEAEGVDSRHLGLIPREHIIGNIFFCWYSGDAERRFKVIR